MRPREVVLSQGLGEQEEQIGPGRTAGCVKPQAERLGRARAAWVSGAAGDATARCPSVLLAWGTCCPGPCIEPRRLGLECLAQVLLVSGRVLGSAAHIQGGTQERLWAGSLRASLEAAAHSLRSPPPPNSRLDLMQNTFTLFSKVPQSLFPLQHQLKVQNFISQVTIRCR